MGYLGTVFLLKTNCESAALCVMDIKRGSMCVRGKVSGGWRMRQVVLCSYFAEDKISQLH